MESSIDKHPRLPLIKVSVREKKTTAMVSQEEAIKQLFDLAEKLEEPLKQSFRNMHQGYPAETLVRFLKARAWNVPKAHQMLIDCINWRMENKIDKILMRPIALTELYKAVRDSQLLGLSGYTKEGLPVFAIGVGKSTYDKGPVDYYVQSHIQINEYRDLVVFPQPTKKYGRYIGTCVKVFDMTCLKLSAISQIKLLTTIATIDDLNYPEIAVTYYVVNTPYAFSKLWKIVKKLLREETQRKIQVLKGNGKEELLKVMDYESLPHFCRKEGRSLASMDDCFSLDHAFHQQLYSYIKQQSGA
ncbi:phosphatidylinositol/phosphatidylcholine transfer protein SFH2-like [Papaver somniferum]|uniref:phosphatidylinositol/phosphatidylcholine transfer protein SFH2-like n=1 Tax=Papaver somniferum TaxID=3469 RepID=UPI000E704343|nr:phosphatidylinositol/phosphatidylcholine transfer protein SFH2-like [Papaver somniferum]XP_026441103.1 phosphatidylinositol/phosphatidylcholine transfer protein SFH2-like [Papaver somniferum]